VLSVHSQTTVAIDLHKSSYLTINGNTNILSFRLFQKGEDLLTKTFTITATQNQNRLYVSQNQITIPVKKFNSDNKMALRDFLKLIKSSDYPELLIQLNYLEGNPACGDKKFSTGNASINITITGVTRQYNIPITSNQTEEFYSIDGKKNINIRDFGLNPPVEMMGLIKVSEWINIDFHFIGHVRTIKNMTQTRN
jgi:hypothetical protein